MLVSLDTTRRDHLSIYGYPRPTTPALERLARTSAVFDNAVAQMTITNPSHASMFTGLYPHTHLVGENTRELPEEFVTLTELLAEQGFRSAAFVSGHPLRPEITGLDQGFEVYDGELKRRRAGRLTMDRALEWLAQRSNNERWFLFVHLYDAHGPYKPSEKALSLFRSPNPGRQLEYVPIYQKVRDAGGKVIKQLNEYVDRYDAMIRYQDDLLGELLDAVDLEHTVVAVVADHGETLAERGKSLNLNHGTSVFEEQIAIPMIIHAPRLQPSRLTRPAETVDLLPTLTELLHVELPPELEIQGESLVSEMRGRRSANQPSAGALAFSSNRARRSHYADRGYDLDKTAFIHSVRSLRWKLIKYPGVEQDYHELYDLAQDPGELHNVASEHPKVRDQLLEALDSWASGGLLPVVDGEVSEADREDLRALGYLGN